MPINSPLPSSLASECRKAARILNSFIDPGHGIDTIIPSNILRNAKGFAIMTVLKGGFLFSGRAGAGLVIAKLPDGSWSAPSAIMTAGMGFGGQVGAELTDFVMVLQTQAAVKAFQTFGNVTLGGNISVAVGPVGRNAEASGAASMKNVAAVYSYSKTRGLFAGVSLEGSVIIERFDANAKMYGYKVKARELLNGSVRPPPEASGLYEALDRRSRFDRGAYSNDMYVSPPSSNDFFSEQHRPGGNNSRSSGDGLTRAQTWSRAAVKNLATGGRAGSSFADDHMPSGRNRSSSTGDRWQPSSHDYDINESSPTNNRLLAPPAAITDDGRPRARALFNFAGEQGGDLPFKKGDIITITKKTETQQDWWTGQLNGNQGIFPANFVEML
ncbi:DUF500-domain-containing protein [Hesseltinella vesiculosa]|uniref:DUF500-domain-containing protein n=1 Tax=Hesseltinella vesiculosa TaxID=101127 RepID=A0A1X2G517_9FUNG|nr:DUF500-domain-containing protein [Hesseltinella vesiculosa]